MSDNIIAVTIAARQLAIAHWALGASITASIVSAGVGGVGIWIALSGREADRRLRAAHARERMVVASIGMRQALDILVELFNTPASPLKVNLTRAMAIARAAEVVIEGVVAKDVGHIGLYHLAINVQTLALKISTYLNARAEHSTTIDRAVFDEATRDDLETLGDQRAQLGNLRTQLDLPNPGFDNPED